jgi:hypothetical protein
MIPAWLQYEVWTCVNAIAGQPYCRRFCIRHSPHQWMYAMWANLWTFRLKSSPISWLILQSFGVHNALFGMTLFGMRSWSCCYWLITKQPPGYHGFIILWAVIQKPQSQLQCFCLQQVSITIRFVQLECKGCWQSLQFFSFYFQLGKQRGYRETDIPSFVVVLPLWKNSPLPKDEYHLVLCLFDHSNLSAPCKGLGLGLGLTCNGFRVRVL